MLQRLYSTFVQYTGRECVNFRQVAKWFFDSPRKVKNLIFFIPQNLKHS